MPSCGGGGSARSRREVVTLSTTEMEATLEWLRTDGGFFGAALSIGSATDAIGAADGSLPGKWRGLSSGWPAAGCATPDEGGRLCRTATGDGGPDVGLGSALGGSGELGDDPASAPLGGELRSNIGSWEAALAAEGSRAS